MDKNTTNDNDSQWTAVLEALSGSLTKGQYATHFLGSTGRFDGSTVTVSLPPSANLPMVENQLQVKVFDAVKRATGGAYAVRFEQGAGKVKPVESEPVNQTTPDQLSVKDKRTNPYFNIENNLFDHGYAAEMKAFHFVVYCYLSRLAGNGSDCYPSYATIAKQCGVSRMSAIRAVKALADLELIKIERRLNDKGEFTSNLISILNCN